MHYYIVIVIIAVIVIVILWVSDKIVFVKDTGSPSFMQNNPREL